MPKGTTGQFIDWEAPPEPAEPSGSWAERVAFQRENAPGEWAKYGPYSSEASAAQTAKRLLKQSNGTPVETAYTVEAEDEAYVFVRVGN